MCGIVGAVEAEGLLDLGVRASIRSATDALSDRDRDGAGAPARERGRAETIPAGLLRPRHDSGDLTMCGIAGAVAIEGVLDLGIRASIRSTTDALSDRERDGAGQPLAGKDEPTRSLRVCLARDTSLEI